MANKSANRDPEQLYQNRGGKLITPDGTFPAGAVLPRSEFGEGTLEMFSSQIKPVNSE